MNDTKVINSVEQFAKNIFENSEGHHDWDHTKRVLNLCLHIQKAEIGVDLEILQIAAILHDIGRPEQDKSMGKICHARRGVELAREFLESLDYSPEKIDAICHCILAHRSRNKIRPESLEAKILFDADKLDSIGAVGIMRACYFANSIGAKIHNKGVDVSDIKDYSQDDTPWCEYQKKLRHIKNNYLYTEEARKIAKERQSYMKRFFEKLDSEIEGSK